MARRYIVFRTRVSWCPWQSFTFNPLGEKLCVCCRYMRNWLINYFSEFPQCLNMKRLFLCGVGWACKRSIFRNENMNCKKVDIMSSLSWLDSKGSSCCKCQPTNIASIFLCCTLMNAKRLSCTGPSVLVLHGYWQYNYACDLSSVKSAAVSKRWCSRHTVPAFLWYLRFQRKA